MACNNGARVKVEQTLSCFDCCRMPYMSAVILHAYSLSPVQSTPLNRVQCNLSLFLIFRDLVCYFVSFLHVGDFQKPPGATAGGQSMPLCIIADVFDFIFSASDSRRPATSLQVST